VPLCKIKSRPKKANVGAMITQSKAVPQTEKKRRNEWENK
jgi:hypothetical protein